MKHDVITPVDGSVYCSVDIHSMTQIHETIEAAKTAQPLWEKTPLAERKQYLTNMVENLTAMSHEIATELAWQMGRPASQGVGEPNGFAERVNYMCSIAEQKLGNIIPEPEANCNLYMKRKPLGVLALLSPWNYPYLTVANVLAPALLAGNTVILKHSLQTPLVAERILTAAKQAGFPEGVFQIVHIGHGDTAKMIAHDDIAGVYFTGSVEAGKKVQQALTHKFVPCGLELGGKDPAYVRADADVDWVAENLVDGAFFNSGQSCCGIERIYVHENVYEQFIAKAVEVTKTYKLGNPLEDGITIGPMVKKEAADFARGQIAEAVSQGAKTLIDESLFPLSQSGTAYLAPQILVDVNHAMRVMHEESFAPIVGIMKVSSDAEAIELMNDSDLGLTASIWTENINEGEQLVDKINTGTAFINRCDYLNPKLAWTGVKNTGRGVSLSELGFGEVTRIQSYYIRAQKQG